MPKMKTRKSAQRRFKITGSGRIKRYRAYDTHLFLNKSSSRKKRLERPAMVSKADEKRIRKLMPYGSG